MRHEHLADGTPLTIRPIRPEDAQAEAAFVRALSPAARHYRFMGSISELSPEMLARFTQIDYRREMALVALTIEQGRALQQGVARYAINPDNRSCEFAIVVSERLQGQGVGTRLMKALMDAARDQRLTRIEGTVLRDNAPMLKLMSELGFITWPIRTRASFGFERAL
ncbi:MAG: GNAT family N-acetyltransferase [Burkholderiaceae bacterium]